MLCRDGVYYFVTCIPVDMQHHYDKCRLYCRLRTQSKARAVRAAQSITQRLDDYSLLSFGAFLPRVDMRGAHCIPKECIKIGADMEVRNHLAMRWGTVRLGDERNEDAVVRFKSGAKNLGIRAANVWIMKTGQTRIIPSN